MLHRQRSTMRRRPWSTMSLHRFVITTNRVPESITANLATITATIITGVITVTMNVITIMAIVNSMASRLMF